MRYVLRKVADYAMHGLRHYDDTVTPMYLRNLWTQRRNSLQRESLTTDVTEAKSWAKRQSAEAFLAERLTFDSRQHGKTTAYVVEEIE